MNRNGIRITSHKPVVHSRNAEGNKRPGAASRRADKVTSGGSANRHSRRGIFGALLSVLMAAIMISSFTLGIFADDAVNQKTVPSDEGYSSTINTIHNRTFSNVTDSDGHGVYQSNSGSSITSFGSALPLSTIYINQDKIWADQNGAKPVAEAEFKLLTADPGIVHYADAGTSPTGKAHYVAYNPNASGAMDLLPDKKNVLSGDLFSFTFPEAAEYTDANGNLKKGSVVFTYSNAEMFVDYRYKFATNGKLNGLYSLATGAQPTWGTNDPTNLSSQNSEVNKILEEIRNRTGVYDDGGTEDVSGATDWSTTESTAYPCAQVGGSIDIRISVVDDEGVPVPGTFALATTGINLDRSPRRNSGTNVNRAMWYYYKDYSEYYYFSEAMSINSGQFSENSYVRNNDPNQKDNKDFAGFYPNVIKDSNGNIKFLSDFTADNGSTDGTYTSGFVLLGNAATGISVTSTGHAGSTSRSTTTGFATRLSAMNSPFFNSTPFWYKYKSSTGPHGNIQITQEGNADGDLSLTGSAQDAVLGQGTYVVMEGKTVTYTMTPDIGYKIKKLTVNGSEVIYDGEAVSKMKKGDTARVTTAAGHTGVLKYEENGTYTFKFVYAKHDEEIYVEWEPTTADILVSKVWADKDDKDGMRVLAYSDPTNLPKFKLQQSTNGGRTYSDVTDNNFISISVNPQRTVSQVDVPSGYDSNSGKYLDGTYTINNDQTGNHPFTWEYLPVYTYDSNGNYDRAITYRIVEIAADGTENKVIAEYQPATYHDAQTFELTSEKTKSWEGWLIYEDSSDGKTYALKGDGKYYEVDTDGNTSATEASTQPDPANLSPISSNVYRTADKAIPYQEVQAKNTHEPQDLYVDVTKTWDDSEVNGLTTTSGTNEYQRRSITIVLHGETENGVVDLNGTDTGEDLELTIQPDEAEQKTDATGDKEIDGYKVYTDGTSEYALVSGDPTYTTDGYYAVSGDSIDYTGGVVTPSGDLTVVKKGDGTYKIDDDNFGAMFENLPTHEGGKLITYTIKEKIGGTDAGDSTLAWDTTGGALTPVRDQSSNEIVGYQAAFTNTPIVEDVYETLSMTILKRDAKTQGALEGGEFTVYLNAVNETKPLDNSEAKVEGQQIYTDTSGTEYVRKQTYFTYTVDGDGNYTYTVANPQPESPTATSDKVEGQTVYEKDGEEYIQKLAYYTFSESGGSYTYTVASPQPDEATITEKTAMVDEVTVTTDTNGQATIKFLEPGTYYVKETKAPTGYTADSTTYMFEVSRDLKSITLKSADDGHDTAWWEKLWNLLFANGVPSNTNWDATNKTLTVDDEPLTASVLVRKYWDDNNDQEGKRPADGDASMPKVSLQWTLNAHTAKGSPVYVDADDNKYIYDTSDNKYHKVTKEDSFGTFESGAANPQPDADNLTETGYTCQDRKVYADTDEKKYVYVDNAYHEVTAVDVEGSVEDDAAADQPKESELELVMDGSWNTVELDEVPAEATVSHAGGPVRTHQHDAYTWDNVPAYRDGKPVVYRVLEEGKILDEGIYELKYNHTSETHEKVFTLADSSGGTVTAHDQTVDVTNFSTATSLTIRKIWVDKDADKTSIGSRPDSITVIVKAETSVETQALIDVGFEKESTAGKFVYTKEYKVSESDGKLFNDNVWQKKIEGIPALDTADKAIEYTVDEEPVPNYTTEIKLDSDRWIIKNTYTRGVFTGTKIWDDGNLKHDNATELNGKLKLERTTADDLDSADWDEVTEEYHLHWKGDGTAVGDKYRQSFEITGLPMEDADDKAYTYRVVESGVGEDYTITYTNTGDFASRKDAVYTGGTVTNTDQESVEVTAEKEWAGDKEVGTSFRKDVVFHLYGLKDGLIVYDAGTKKIEMDDEGEPEGNATWKLPKHLFKDTETSWEVVEDAVPAYVTEVTGDAENGFTVTNTYAGPVTEVEVSKEWQDQNDAAGRRPDSITYELWRKVGDSDPEKYDEKVAGESDGWKAKWTDLPVSEEQDTGETDTESRVEYVTRYKNIDDDTDIIDETAYNSLPDSGPAKTDYEPADNEGEYVNIDDDTDKIDQTAYDALPDSGPFKTDYEETQVAETIEETTKVTEEVAVIYFIKETYDGTDLETNGYKEPVVESTGAGTYNVVNIRDIDKTDIKVRKVWVDDDDKVGVRPDHVDFVLKADGEAISTARVSADDKDPDDESKTWTYVFEDLDITDIEGKVIEYSVDEEAVPGYSSSASGEGTAENPFIFTNTYNAQAVTLTAVKKWVADDDNKDKRKDVTFHLVKVVDGESSVVEGQDKTIEADKEAKAGEDAGSASWSGLPAKENGKDVSYTVSEDAIDDYKTSISDVRKTGEDNTFEVVVSNEYVASPSPVIEDKSGDVIWLDPKNSKGKMILRSDKYDTYELAEEAAEARKNQPDDPSHKDVKFIGWDLNVDENGNYVLVAMYSDNAEKVTPVVSYIDPQSGKPLLVSKYADDPSSVKAPKDPSHDGLIFEGWVETKDAAGNTIFVAKYSCDCEEGDCSNGSKGSGNGSNNSKSAAKGTSVNTADDSMLYLRIGVFIVLLALIVLISIIRRRHSSSD